MNHLAELNERNVVVTKPVDKLILSFITTSAIPPRNRKQKSISIKVAAHREFKERKCKRKRTARMRDARMGGQFRVSLLQSFENNVAEIHGEVSFRERCD